MGHCARRKLLVAATVILCALPWKAWADISETTVLQAGNVLSLDDYMTFANAAGDSIEGFASARLTISADKTGMVFKKATFTSLSGELSPLALFNETPANLFGSFSVKGSSLPAEKVPAEARALVADNGCAP